MNFSKLFRSWVRSGQKGKGPLRNRYRPQLEVLEDRTVPSAATQTALGASSTSLIYGQAVKFTAKVTDSVHLTPIGNVAFMDGSIVLATKILNSHGVAYFDTSGLHGGSHNITAVYQGDSNLQGSTSNAVTETVSTAATSTTLTASPTTAPSGQPITFTATVTDTQTSKTPKGIVDFLNGTHVMGHAKLTNGVAVFASSTLSGGAHSITAVYKGDIDFATSTSPAVAVTVTLTTKTTLAANPTSAPLGQPITFTATVTATGKTPTGWLVVFEEVTSTGTKFLGTGKMSGGKATLVYGAFKTKGGHKIQATYKGFNEFLGSTSTAITVMVT